MTLSNDIRVRIPFPYRVGRKLELVDQTLELVRQTRLTRLDDNLPEIPGRTSFSKFP